MEPDKHIEASTHFFDKSIYGNISDLSTTFSVELRVNSVHKLKVYKNTLSP